MRVLRAGVAVALLASLTLVSPAAAARPAPAADPYISRVTAEVRWYQDSESLDWHYVLEATVYASGLGFRPSYMPCTKVTYQPSGTLVDGDQQLLASAPRPHMTVSSSVDVYFFSDIVTGSTSIDLTSQLMRLGNHGCCTNVGSLRALTAALPNPAPAHDQTVVVLDESFPAP